MTTIVGADGCRSGWLCIFEELPSRRIGSKVFAPIAELFAAAPDLDLLAIDIPIGLTEAGPRHDLVSGHFGQNAYETIRARYPRKGVANDDILDAFAALWTAERILNGNARSLPLAPAVDSAELPMRIVY
jgi:predicted RNase H-like nuclease